MTATRRAFLQATTLGVASCALPARAQPASPRLLIDFHAHWIGPRVVELLSARTSIQMAAEEAGQPIPAKRFRSVYLDTGQSGRGPRGIALAATVFGIDRILFGTDSGPVASVTPTIESVKRTALTLEEKNQIFVENGRRLLEAREGKVSV